MLALVENLINFFKKGRKEGKGRMRDREGSEGEDRMVTRTESHDHTVL